jgi:transcription elongation factor Elf1
MNDRSYVIVQCPLCGAMNTVMEPKRKKDSNKIIVCKNGCRPFTMRYNNKTGEFYGC